VLFREQRSNRWYIRSSKDISERGMYFALQGYEAQVFLDIREVSDLAPGNADYRWESRWSKLNYELNGRGVADVDAACQDIFLAELYNPFLRLFSPEGTGELLHKDRPPLETSVIWKSSAALIIQAIRHLGGADGRYEPFKTERNYTPVPEKDIADDLIEYLDRIRELFQNSVTLEFVLEKLDAKTVKFIGVLRDAFDGNNSKIILYAAGYGVFRMLRRIIGEGASGEDARVLVEHWGLDRKLREIYQTQGIDDEEAYRVTEIMKTILARTSPDSITDAKGGAKKAGDIPSAVDLVRNNAGADDFKRILRTNFFSDTIWFNKEAFEEFLFYASLFTLLDYGFSWAKTIAVYREQFIKAEAASGFRLDGLIAALTEKPKAASKTGAKAATPEKKTGGGKTKGGSKSTGKK
jgi:hypothetical protein